MSQKSFLPLKSDVKRVINIKKCERGYIWWRVLLFITSNRLCSWLIISIICFLDIFFILSFDRKWNYPITPPYVWSAVSLLAGLSVIISSKGRKLPFNVPIQALFCYSIFVTIHKKFFFYLIYSIKQDYSTIESNLGNSK